MERVTDQTLEVPGPVGGVEEVAPTHGSTKTSLVAGKQELIVVPINPNLNMVSAGLRRPSSKKVL